MRNVLSIVISGKQGSGKSSLCKRLQQHFDTLNIRVAKHSFATPIKEIEGVVRAYLQDNFMDVVYNENKGQWVKFPADVQDKRMQQLIGTEWGRKSRGQNLWTKFFQVQLQRTYDQFTQAVVLVDDARFLNELAVFDRSKSIFIRLDAAREVRKARCDAWREDEGHESETALDSFTDWDLVLDTDESGPDGIKKTLDAVLAKVESHDQFKIVSK